MEKLIVAVYMYTEIGIVVCTRRPILIKVQLLLFT